MESMRAHFEREPDAEWTGYNGSLSRTLLNSEKVLAKLSAPPDVALEAAPSEPAEPEIPLAKAAVAEGE
ncbi:MAG: hypothetical protein JO065_11205 [Acidobacteria bacterium]|nr:hypothetical protein [Acidobacteriota bacterium]